jgi:arginase
MPVSTQQVVALVGRTSDRAEGRAAGAQALARALSDAARVVGEPARPRVGRYDHDLHDARSTLEAAAAAVAEMERPLLTATDCSICVGTVPAVGRRWPGAWLLWLDAHGDFNTPETTPSGFLGGMCLAGAVGLWDTGYGAGPGPERVVLVGGRDLDDAEVELMERHGVVRTGDPAAVLAGREVFVHLDVDILDPTVLPGQLYPAPGGLDAAQLRDLLAGVAARARIVGAEITCFSTPELSDALAQAVAPLMESPAP